MRLRKLVLQDFLSHAYTEINFADEPLQLHGRNFDHQHPGWSNGAGKSTPLYAICWALWGKIPAPQKTKDQLIRYDQLEAKVTLHLAGSDGSLEVTRCKSRGQSEQVQAFYNNQRVPGERDECQANLQRLYGISWEVFCNTVFLGPKSPAVQFVNATPTERAALLSELVNLQPFLNAAVILDTELSTRTLRHQELITLGKQLAGQISDVDQDIARITTQHQAEQSTHNKHVQLTEFEINKLTTEALQLTERLRNPPDSDIAHIRARENQQAEEVRKLESDVSVLAAKLSMARPEAGSTCPTCNQLFGGGAHANLEVCRAEWREQGRMKQLDLSQARAGLHATQEDLQVARDWERERVRIEQRMEDIKGLAYKARASLQNRSLAILHAEMERAKLQRLRLSEMAAGFQKELHGINERVPVLKTLSAGFKQEIRNLLLDDIRVGLTAHTTEFLEVLAEHEFSIRFPQQSKTGREKFDIEIYVGKDEPISSPGEEYRAKLAILLALRRVLQTSAVGCLDFLMIDDPLMGVDGAGDVAFGKLVEILARHQPQILITVPRPVEGLNCKTLLVERTARVSRVLVEI